MEQDTTIAVNDEKVAYQEPEHLLPRRYVLLLGGFFISTVGNWLYQLALPLLVYTLTHSALNMALTYGLTYLPFVLFSPFGGIVADRVDRRRFLVLGDLFSALVVGLLVLVVSLGIHSLLVIYPLVFMLAGIMPFYHPAFQSLVPSLVKDHQLARANAWLQGAENIVMVVGPLIGGLLIVSLGVTSVLTIDMFSFVGSAVLIACIGNRSGMQTNEGATGASLLAQLYEGLSYTWRHPILRYGSFVFLGTNFALAAIEANYVYFLTKVLGASPVQLGLAFAIPGLGAIGGAIIAPRLGRRFSPGPLILGCSMVAGLMLLPLLVATNSLLVAVPWAVVTGAGTVSAVTWFTLRQRLVPQSLLGRVIAFTRLFAYAAVPLSAVASGIILGTTRDIHLIIGIAAAIDLVVGGLGWLTPLSQRKKEDTPMVAPNM